MTAFQTIILFSDGAPLTPAGGSSCSLNENGNKFLMVGNISYRLVVTSDSYETFFFDWLLSK